MLDKTHRFRGRAGIGSVFRRSRTVRQPFVMLRYAPARRLRAAVVVSKKVDKSAVVRNRIRRRVYSFVRERIDPNTPHDIIVTIHSSELATIDRAAFDHTLETVFQKAGILTHTSSKNE